MTLPLPWLILLGAFTALGLLSIDMYLPAFPAMQADFDASPGTMEYTLAASLGFVGPNAAAALATHGQRAGMASALMGAPRFVLAFLFGALVGGLHDGSARPLAILSAAGGVGAWLARRQLAARLGHHGHLDH